MEKVNIDYNKIAADITEKCNSLLSVIDENSISDTFDAVKEIAEIAVQSYSYRISDLWKAENANSDIQEKIQFTDLETGYLKLVRKWVRNNPLNTKLPLYPEEPIGSYDDYASITNKKAAVFGVAGTTVIGISYAKGWWILGNPIVAIAAELITLAIIYKTVQSKKSIKRKELDAELKVIREKQNNYKKQLIDHFVTAVTKWLNTAVEYSDSILEKF